MNFEDDEFERMLRQFRPRKPRPLPQMSSVGRKYRIARWLIPAVALSLLAIVSIPNFWNVRAVSANPIILSDTHGYDFTNYLKEARAESLHSAGWLSGGMMIGGAAGCLHAIDRFVEGSGELLARTTQLAHELVNSSQSASKAMVLPPNCNSLLWRMT